MKPRVSSDSKAYRKKVSSSSCLKVTSHLRGWPSKKKNRTCAGFNKIPTNYISEESLINGVYDKSIVYAIFPFSKCEEEVRVETTKARSSEFIGYRIPQHMQNERTQSFTKYQ